MNADVGVVHCPSKEAEAKGAVLCRIVWCGFIAVIEPGDGYFIAYKEPASVGFYEGAGVAEFGVIYREPVHQCLSGEAKPLRRVTLGYRVPPHEC